MARSGRLWLTSAAFVLAHGVVTAAPITASLEQTAPVPIVFTEGVDFVAFNAPASQANAATGEVTAPLHLVDFAGLGSGCEPSDFAGFAAGTIAVVSRGTCTFAQKILNATAAGAVGALIVNNLDVLGDGFGLGISDPTTIPALLVDDDSALALTGGLTGSISLRNIVHMTLIRTADVPIPGSVGLLALGFALLGFVNGRRA